MLDFMNEIFCLNIKSKMVVIPHCSREFRNIITIENLNGWLVHTGEYYDQRISDSFFMSIKYFRTKYPDNFKGLLIVGNIGRKLKEYIKTNHLENYVKIIGFVSPDEAFSYMCSADANLVIDADNNNSLYLPSKFVDCALAKKPLLVITPQNGPMRDYINKYGGGVAVNHSKKEIIDALENIFIKKINYNSNLYECFSQKEISKQYINIFNLVLNRK